MIITLQTLMFFRESLVNALDRWLRPYYKKFSLTLGRNDDVSEDEESDEHVFAEFDEERGVVFYPPMYLQRYAAVSDCLLDQRWCGKLEKVVDLGYHDMSFIKYLKEVQGIKSIMGVDLESIPLHYSSDIFGCDDYGPKRENPLEITLFKGNAADPDYRLIGTDAVIAIEMIEHMLPHDLDRLIHTIFGFVKPRVAIFTTPNGDFNVLFKAMEKNGLRRLDHFFEWSREQFHDWCSNIVVRYPQYTVSCKGIGPGPSGTKHLGCCSQMALFIAKDYNKQPNLNLNSLALVPDSVSPNSISNMVSSWESIPNESHMIEGPQNIKSYSELAYSEKESSITLVLTTSSLSSDIIPYQEKASQCNLDTEAGKNYLMFDYEQMCFDVLVPTKKMVNRVYDIEDVNSRLNCTTLQVKKFSKTTQNLMAKNKLDVLVHTREVVDEIRQLTRMLNFSKDCNNQLENGDHTWCNINWGENAPYWNQYYVPVMEYTYPFETKSEEGRILDLISDEINRLIDTQFDDELLEVPNKLKIPIENLMKVVQDITDDVEKVKDLLEWNGYEVVDDMVIHSRLVVNCSSVDTQEYDSQDTDICCSDWDSVDIRSTTMSDGSTPVPDHYARCLRRALDEKVRKLRSVLIADEDITTELDLVVCRLMKLALQTSRGRNAPPPTRWMQRKLLDLLTLTEKTIERRKKLFIENYPLKAINCDEKSEGMTALEKIKGDNTASKIVDKYEHLVKNSNCMEEIRANYQFVDMELVDDISVSSGDFGINYDYVDKSRANFIGLEPALADADIFDQKKDTPQESKLERTQAWVEEDIEVVPYPRHRANFDNSSIETDKNNTYVTKYYKKRYKGKKCIDLNCVICKKSHSKGYKQNRSEERIKENAGKTKNLKKAFRKKSSNNSLGLHANNKFVSVDYKTYKVKPRRKQHKPLYPTISKPIPTSLIDICQIEDVIESYNNPVTGIKADKSVMLKQLKPEVADTKRSLLIDIITEDTQETIALRRTIGTDVVDPMLFEDEKLIRSYSNTLINEDNLFEKRNAATGEVNSHTIFLYDIDEPTTSKGIRHTGMDVQCGPDDIVPTYSELSATTSSTRLPKILSAGIKIGDSIAETNTKSNVDCCTCTYEALDTNSYKTISPRERSIGIKIKDSYSNIKHRELSTVPAYLTRSLTRVPKMPDGLKTGDSKIDKKIKSTCANYTQKKDHSKERSVGITSKGSTTTSIKQLEFPTLPAYSMLSATTSLTEMPQIFSMRIKITDSSPNIRISTISKETTLQKNTPQLKPVDFTVQDSDPTMKRSTNTLNNDKKSNGLSLETDFINLLTNAKTEDATSDLFGSVDSCATIPIHCETTLQNSDLQIISAVHKENVIPGQQSKKFVRTKLCNGGLQVHSYRDKTLSEDIMYQGEWQNNRPKVLTKKKLFNPIVTKKDFDSNLKRKVKPKETFQKKSSVEGNKKEARDSNKNYIKLNKKIPVTPTGAKAKKPFRNILKVPSNIIMRSVSSKKRKSEGIVKKPLLNPNLTDIKDDVTHRKIVNKNYIPLYLRQKAFKRTSDISPNDLNVNLDSAECINQVHKPNIKTTKQKTPKTFARTKTVEIRRDLLKFHTSTPIPQYVVLRNEIGQNNRDTDRYQIRSVSDSAKKRNNASRQRSVSPGTSPNSSSCSSPCSVATVRAVSVRSKNVTAQRHSTSPYKNNIVTSGSESATPERIRKFTKRSKSSKITAHKVSDNKENIPQTSKQNNFAKKESLKFGKHSFMSQKKDVYIVHLKDSPPLQLTANTLSKHKSQKSNVNVPKADGISQKRSLHIRSPSLSERTSLKCDTPLTTNYKNNVSETSQTSNMVLVIEPQTRELQSSDSPKSGNVNVVNQHLVTNSIDHSDTGAIESHTSNIMSAMRELIDETLDFIDDPMDRCIIDSETVILSREDLSSHIGSVSPTSFKTTISNNENSNDILQDDIEFALNRSFDTTLGNESILSLEDVRLTVTDFDVLSFKSVTSASKISDYLSAENESDSSRKFPISPRSPTSVRDIFERRDQPFQPAQIQNTPGALALQAFSGFSINGDPCPGDRPDYVNFMDSETGSLALDVARQATSEEVLISGRSSESYQSCLIDEDAVVPNWLFQIISQQQSAMDEVEAPAELMPLANVEPMYDTNGNLVTPVVGAGAGDGRGMHSEHSQDSSGRGTSISSSDTSSGQQSETILNDPSSFVAQFELLRDAVETSVVLAINDTSDNNAVGSRQDPIETDSRSFSRGESRRMPRARPATNASDVDADVSSLDTDADAYESDN